MTFPEPRVTLPARRKRRFRPKRISALVVELDDGRRAVLPRSYVETSTSLGYALTVFRSQGITVDHTFGLGGDSLFQEAGYTQLSRGRLSNNLYVAAPENPRWEIGHHADDTAQRDALQSLVERSRTVPGTDHGPGPSRGSGRLLSPADLAATYGQHATLARWLCDHAPPDVTDELAAASDRAHHARIAGRDTQSAEADVSALVARQRRRDEWVASHRDEITTWSRLERDVRRYEYRLGQAASYTATRARHGTARPPPRTRRPRRTVAERGGSHRGVSHPMEHRRPSHPRPRTGRSRATCPLGQDRCHRRHGRVPHGW